MLRLGLGLRPGGGPLWRAVGAGRASRGFGGCAPRMAAFLHQVIVLHWVSGPNLLRRCGTVGCSSSLQLMGSSFSGSLPRVPEEGRYGSPRYLED